MHVELKTVIYCTTFPFHYMDDKQKNINIKLYSSLSNPNYKINILEKKNISTILPSYLQSTKLVYEQSPSCLLSLVKEY